MNSNSLSNADWASDLYRGGTHAGKGKTDTDKNPNQDDSSTPPPSDD